MLAIIDSSTGLIYFGIAALVACGALWTGWRALRGRGRWLLLLPALVAGLVMWAVFDSLVLAPVRWEREGVCSGWWQAVPTYLEDGTHNRKPELCIAPM